MGRHWRRLERELEDEMRFHLEMTEAKNRAAGMPEEEARCAAARTLGNLTLERERSREF